MKTRILILFVCISLIAAGTLAHGGEEHVIGTVMKVAQNSITVQTTANDPVTVAIAPETKFMKAKAAAKVTDLNVGDRVVIHAKEISEGNLVADTVEFAAGTQSETQTLTGVVSDSNCGASHAMKNMSAADCTHMCVKAGRKYALVVGADVYTLQGHEVDLQKLSGDTVIVKGSVRGNAVTVVSVAAEKKGQ